MDRNESIILKRNGVGDPKTTPPQADAMLEDSTGGGGGRIYGDGQNFRNAIA